MPVTTAAARLPPLLHTLPLWPCTAWQGRRFARVGMYPVQVGTNDGRVKIIGKPGVEVTMRSTSRAPTKYLGFLANKGGVLRVTQVSGQ